MLSWLKSCCVGTGVPSAQHSWIGGDGAADAAAMEEASVTVLVRNKGGMPADVSALPSERISAVLHNDESGSTIKATVSHVGLGQYAAKFVPKMSGMHTLNILLGESHIQASPHKLAVTAGTSLAVAIPR